jgi:hypothetical protein
MKRFILISLFIFSGSLFLNAQTVNDVPIKDIDVEYVQIVGTAKPLSNKVSIEIDFGQQNKLFRKRDTQLRDENGDLVEFNSMIDALNFMSKNGYKYKDAYALTIGNMKVYHYLLQKE